MTKKMMDRLSIYNVNSEINFTIGDIYNKIKNSYWF